MNILIVANHYACCSARYATDAFTRLGHNVTHLGTPMGRDIWGMQVPAEYVWEPSPGMTRPFPDVVIVMDSDPAVLDMSYGYTAGSLNCPVIVWGVDNHVRDYRRPYFDHYFLAHKSVSVMAWEDVVTLGGLDTGQRMPVDDMTWLPCATDSIAFPPSPIPWAERAYDVCMIGVMYPQRWALVNAMRNAGLQVLAGTGLVYDAYRDAYHNSRVALVSSACGDLPIRLFEGAGMGCAVLADEIVDLFELRGDDPIQTYVNAATMVDIAKELQDLADIGALSVEWAQQHTFDARAQVIIDWLAVQS